MDRDLCTLRRIEYTTGIHVVESRPRHGVSFVLVAYAAGCEDLPVSPGKMVNVPGL